MIRHTLALVAALLLARPALADPAIWVVRSPTATIYLFGTMHILPKPAAWFTPRIEAAFNASATLYEEADVGIADPGVMQRVMAQSIDPKFDLWSKLPRASADQLRAELARCHMSDRVVAHFRPWLASMLPTICDILAQSAANHGPAPAAGPEAALLRRAAQSHKATAFFETAEEQIAYLSGATEAIQIAKLERAIAEATDAKSDDIAQIEAAWLAGNTGAIEAMGATMRARNPDLYDTIFTQRNQRFADRLARLLKTRGTTFVAIGAGHLAGPDSVQAALARQGVNTVRVTSP